MIGLQHVYPDASLDHHYGWMNYYHHHREMDIHYVLTDVHSAQPAKETNMRTNLIVWGVFLSHSSKYKDNVCCVQKVLELLKYK
jgi:hypothetical protein